MWVQAVLISASEGVLDAPIPPSSASLVHKSVQHKDSDQCSTTNPAVDPNFSFHPESPQDETTSSWSERFITTCLDMHRQVPWPLTMDSMITVRVYFYVYLHLFISRVLYISSSWPFVSHYRASSPVAVRRQRLGTSRALAGLLAARSARAFNQRCINGVT